MCRMVLRGAPVASCVDEWWIHCGIARKVTGTAAVVSGLFEGAFYIATLVRLGEHKDGAVDTT